MQKDKLISSMSHDDLIFIFFFYALVFLWLFTLLRFWVFLLVMAIPTLVWVRVFQKVEKREKLTLAFMFLLLICGLMAVNRMFAA